MTENKIVITPACTLDGIENQLKEYNGKVTDEFVATIFRLYMMEEYMAKFGFIYNVESQLFEKFYPESSDIAYFFKKLEKENLEIKDSRTYKQLKLMVDVYIASKRHEQKNYHP